MGDVRVKICGITSGHDLRMAADAGADALGFVVEAPKSPRNLNFLKARRLMREVPPFVAKVAVTVFSSDETIARIVSGLAADFVQIHGGKTTHLIELKEKLGNFPMIRSVDTFKLSEKELAAVASFEAVMLDSAGKDGYGGTGRVCDWSEARGIISHISSTPTILAGGLNPENVRAAVNQVQPYAVDVSSGVEQAPGRKDPNRVREFIAEAKNAS